MQPDTEDKLIIAIIVGLLLFLFIVFVFIFSVYRYYRLQEVSRLERRSLVDKSKKEILKVRNETMEIVNSHISEYIHDHICQLLTVMKLQLGLLGEADNQINQDRLDHALSLNSEVLTDLRNLSHMLDHDYIESTRLSELINKLASNLSQLKKYEVDLNIVGEVDKVLFGDRKVIIFRTLQELIQNVIKHAQATAIRILIVCDQAGMKLKVSDNGIGLEGQVALGFGLRKIDYRIGLLGGSVQLDKYNDEGTTVEIIIPQSAIY